MDPLAGCGGAPPPSRKAPELWRRFTITLRRLLDSHLRAIGEPTKGVRLNYVKVAVHRGLCPGEALDQEKAALAQRMHTSGESANTIATALGVSRATAFRVLAEQTAEGDLEDVAPLPRWTRDSRNSTRVFEFCSGLVDLVVCVGHHCAGGHSSRPLRASDW